MRVALCVVSVFAWTVPVTAEDAIPRAALQYKRALIGNARLVWGLDAPVALIASQLHQESGFRADAKSAYAGGLAQFTSATASWLSEKYPDELGDNNPFEPSWALRAVNKFDRFLWERASYAADKCSRASFMLAGYNGGESWALRDRALAKSKGRDPNKWFGHVEYYSSRAAWAYKENRDYVRKILLRWQPLYLTWGSGIECKGVV